MSATFVTSLVSISVRVLCTSFVSIYSGKLLLASPESSTSLIILISVWSTSAALVDISQVFRFDWGRGC